VSISKFGSYALCGGGPPMEPDSLNGCLAASVACDVFGPPGGWVKEYMCHPSLMFAVSVTANFSPGFSVFSGPFADHSTLSLCALAHTAASSSANTMKTLFFIRYRPFAGWRGAEPYRHSSPQ